MTSLAGPGRRRPRAAGQAATEFLITATFVLVPLLLLIPLLGRYIDIQHTAIQAARYEAWEYTVWYGDSSDMPSGFSGDQPLKAPDATQRESRARFFGRTDRPIDSANDDAGINPANAAERNPHWVDHRKQPLWTGTIVNNTEPQNSEATPDLTGGVMNFLLDVIDTVAGAIGWFLDAVAGLFGGASPVEFDVINTAGYAKSDVRIPVQTPPGLVDVRTIHDEAGGDTDVLIGELTFRAEAGVLTDAWNAGGVKHVQDRSGGIILTRMLGELIEAIPGLEEVWAILSLLAPEIALCDPPFAHPLSYVPGAEFDPEGDGSLWWGYVNVDAVPPDRLEGGGDIACENGLCAFDPAPSRSPCGGI
jgi:hypothetical protein